MKSGLGETLLPLELQVEEFRRQTCQRLLFHQQSPEVLGLGHAERPRRSNQLIVGKHITQRALHIKNNFLHHASILEHGG